MDLSARQVANLAANLPSDAALNGGWGIQDELAAQTVEVLDAVRIQVAGLSGDRKVKRWKRLKVPRPGQPEPKKTTWRDYARNLAETIRR